MFHGRSGNAQGGLGCRQAPQWCHTNFETFHTEGLTLKGIPLRIWSLRLDRPKIGVTSLEGVAVPQTPLRIARTAMEHAALLASNLMANHTDMQDYFW